MSYEENDNVCLNCGNSLMDDELEFCEDCEDMICEGDISYFPGENELKKYYYNFKSKVDLKKYGLSILGLFGLMIYVISNIYFQNSLNFITMGHFTPINSIYTQIIVFLVSVGIFGSFYLNVKSLIGPILLLLAGFLLFLINSEFYFFTGEIFLYLQYIGGLIVFATGIIGVVNQKKIEFI